MRLQQEGATLGDDQRVVDRFRQVSKKAAHFACGFETVLGRKPAPVLVRDVDAFRDTKQRVMGFKHVLVRKEGLVCRHQWKFQLIGKIEESLLRRRLLLQPVALDFDVEAAWKNPRKRDQTSARRFGLPPHEVAADGALRAPGKEDQPLARGFEVAKGDVRVRARPLFEEGLARQPDQAAIARLVLHEKNKCVVPCIFFRTLLFIRQRHLATENRLNAGRRCRQ